jgi:hypothetical protein
LDLFHSGSKDISLRMAVRSHVQIVPDEAQQ